MNVIFNLAIIFVISCFFPVFPVYSLSNSHQFKADDFLQTGVENIKFNNYIKAVEDFTQAIELKNNFPAAY
ncbi:MAG: hypothetical protein AAFR83_15125, partial [Cyanobacteria bacterium J06629_18]